MNTQLAYPLGFIRSPFYRNFYRTPPLPDETCAQLQRYPWSRPVLKQVIATLLNLPCATVLQLEGLTGFPACVIGQELLAASQATATTPRLVAPIGGIPPTENLHPDLKAFIGEDELWAIDPRVSRRLRMMALVPSHLKPLRFKGPFDTEAGRGFLTTSGGAFVSLQDLVHSELTSQLSRRINRRVGADQSALVLHEPLLRHAFGWTPLTPQRAAQIRAGQPLWNVFHDCILTTWGTGFASGSRIRKIVLPMDIPDGWLVLRIKLKQPYLDPEVGRWNEQLATHRAVGIRLEVELTGKSSQSYVRLFEQLPLNQAVLYLSPSPALRARIRKLAQNFPQVFVPDLVGPPEGSNGCPQLEPTEILRALQYAAAHGPVPFPLCANLHLAAQDPVFDLYRAASVTPPSNGPTKGEGK
jgi:hypothetical protein